MNRKTKTRVMVAMTGMALLTGCAEMSKEGVGTVAGAVIGGVLGKQIGGRGGLVVGAAIGGLLGNRFGAYLDEEDRKRLASASERAVSTGAEETFTATKSGARVTVKPMPVAYEPRGQVILAPDLANADLVSGIPTVRETIVTTPIYRAPRREARLVKYLVPKGNPTELIAWDRTGRWALVGAKGVGIGYVEAKYFESAILSDPAYIQEVRGRSSPVKGTAVVASGTRARKAGIQDVAAGQGDRKSPERSLPPESGTQIIERPVASTASSPSADYMPELARMQSTAVSTSSGQTAGRSAPASSSANTGRSPAETGKVAVVAAECRVLTRTIEVPGGPSGKEDVKYCNQPPSGWKAVT